MILSSFRGGFNIFSSSLLFVPSFLCLFPISPRLPLFLCFQLFILFYNSLFFYRLQKVTCNWFGSTFLWEGVCVLQQWLLSVFGRGLDFFFLFFDIFSHFSFPLTLFSLSTQGNWHGAGQFQFFYRREGLFQQSCSRFLGGRKSHFFSPPCIYITHKCS